MDSSKIKYAIFEALTYKQTMSITSNGINYEIAPLGIGHSIKDKRKNVLLAHVYGQGYPIDTNYKITNENKNFKLFYYSVISLAMPGQGFEIDDMISGLSDGYIVKELVNVHS